MRLAQDHPIITSAIERGIIDRGARYTPTRRPFLWSKAPVTISEQWGWTMHQHTEAYRVFWCGPANDRDHCRW